MDVMKKSTYGKPSLAISLAVVFCLAFSALSCGGKDVSRKEVEEIDAAFRAGASNLVETTAFIVALEEFDFENAGFLDNALNALDTSRDAARELIVSTENLLALSYTGGLAQLGEYIREYCDATIEAVGELEAVYESLESILKAIEPVLLEEAVITQLEAPQSDAEWLERLERLDTALQVSLGELEGVEVPPLLVEYKALYQDLLSTLYELIGDLTATVLGQIANEDMEDNPDFLHMQGLIESYLPLVESIYDGLKITTIDPLVEKVELEINNLYMGEGG